jgi:Ca2+-binding RTX toxin-like protein
MAQFNSLLNLARTLASSTGSATGVSVANANLVAVAGGLTGMQLAGYELVSTDLISNISILPVDINPEQSQAGIADESAVNQREVPSDLDAAFANLVDSNAVLDAQDFMIEQSTQFGLPTSGHEISDLMLEHSFMLDPSQLDGVTNESQDANSQDYTLPSSRSGEESQLSLDQNSDSGSTPQKLDVKNIQNSISQAADSTSSIASYTSSTGSSATDSGSPLESIGFVYYSVGNGDVVSGSGSADTLFGSTSGDDTLIGGDGSDAYAIYARTTVISEVSNGGSADTAYIGVDNYEGTDGIERVAVLSNQAYLDFSTTSGPYEAGLDSGWHINGSSDLQTLIGGSGADILNGGGGADTLIGGAGDDVYLYAGLETIVESNNAGRDIVLTSANLVLPDAVEVGVANNAISEINLQGNSLDNLLVGNAAANTLIGGAGADTLVGNGGEDVFIGGAGSDIFILNGSENYLGTINDFYSGEDRIYIATTDASITLSLSPDDGFSGVVGEILVTDGALQFDWDGDSQSDSLLLVSETPALSDLMLIDHNNVPYF